MITRLSAAVFHVADLEAALNFYKEVLGFEEDFRVGDYAAVKLGEVILHLAKHGDGEFAKPLGGSIVYIYCDEVDRYFRQINGKGLTVKYSPQNTHYGMREFMVADLDGHHLAFGCRMKDA